jgi:hypothetical protein
MATQTPYFGLTKSGGTEAALIGVYNNNMDIIDLEIWQSMVRAAINLAPIYDETAAYVEGSYCTLLETIQQTVTGFHLYKCTTDTTDPAGTFDPNSWSEVDITSEMGHGGGGGGGHIYLDNSGNVMTQRTKAKFEGAYTTDNGTNDITNVAVMRTMKAMEYAQLTEAEKQGIIYVDDETTGTDDKFQPVIYSTEEREIGVWTDGKPLYEKTYVFDIDDLVNGTISSSLMDGQFILDQLSYDMLEMVDAFFTNIGGQNSVKSNPVNYANGDTYVRANIQYESNVQKYIIYFKLTYSVANLYSDRDYLKFYFKIRYTKTPDTAGSGQWTPQGAPTVHYSTTEQLVRTYHGEPLYQKDIEIPLENVTTMQTFTPSDTDIGTGSRIQVVIDAAFENSGGQRLRQSTWYGNNYWTYMTTSQGNILVKKETTDPNWVTGVKLIMTVQYTKASS